MSATPKQSAPGRADDPRPADVTATVPVRPASDPRGPRLPPPPTPANGSPLVAARPPDRGDLVGRYVVLHQLGEGGMGVVYAAYDPELDRRLAVKVVRSSGGVADHDRERLLREAQALGRLKHPNVVAVHDVGAFDDQVFLAMELVEGQTLGEWLKERPRGWREVVAVLSEAGKGLEAAHQAGLVHRDFKPGNVMIDGSGRVFVVDFGLARRAGPREPSASVRDADPAAGPHQTATLGTPRYMSPEQHARVRADARSDQFSFCATLYEALYDQRPFEADPPPAEGDAAPGSAAMASHWRLRQPGRGKRVPAWLFEIIERGLAPRPEDRHPSMEALLRRIEQQGSRSRLRLRWAAAALIGLAAMAIVLPLQHWLRGRLPSSDRRVAIEAVNLGSESDAWLGQAVHRLATKKLRLRERRFQVAGQPGQANVVAKIGYRREGAQVWLEVEVGPAGGRSTRIATARADSMVEALDRVVGPLEAHAGEGQPVAGPDAAEQADMSRLGTASFPAYRAYLLALEEEFDGLPGGPFTALIEAAVRADPGWAHAHAAAADYAEVLAGQQALLQRARRQITDPLRDPSGMQVLAAIEAAIRGERTAAVQLLEPVYRAEPQDVLVGFKLAENLTWLKRSQEAIGVLRQLHAARPGLQFGTELQRALRDAGRTDEVEPLQRAWLARAPESQALHSQIVLDLERGRPDEAVRRARDMALLLGRQHSLGVLCDALIAADRPREAREFADELVRGPDKQAGWRRAGEIAILEGRFSAAYEAMQQAVRLGGGERLGGSELFNAFEALGALASVAGHGQDVAENAAALEDALARSGVPWLPVIQFERALLDKASSGCPAPEPLLARIPAGPGRLAARRDMLRASAAAGCAPCSAVVQAGLSAEERSARSLRRFGVCAEQEGALVLAKTALERASRIRTRLENGTFIASTFDAILARFHLARVLGRLGRPAEASQLYSSFLQHWQHADRALPELDEARAALQQGR